jgi:hypothetical protein
MIIMPTAQAERTHEEATLAIDGRSVRTIGTIEPPAIRAAQLQARGIATPTLHELHPDEAQFFKDRITHLANPSGNKWHACIDPYKTEGYAKMRLFVTDDGTAGGALNGEWIVSGFVYPKSPYRSSVRSSLSALIAEGGRRIACFDTALPGLYAPEGMVPVARTEFFDTGLPEGWDLDTYAAFNGGRPNTLFMAYSEAAIDSEYVPGSGVLLPTHEAANVAVTAYLEALESLRFVA